MFPDPRLVAAIVDRVTFNAHIPAVHQQGDLSPQRTGLASRSRRAYHADSAGIRPRSRLLTEVHILQITQPAILDEQNERAGNPTPQPRPPARQQTTDGQPQSQPPTTTADLACSRNSSAPTKSHDSTRSSMRRSSALSGLGVSTSTPQACLAGPPGHDRPGLSLHECPDGNPGVGLMPLIRMASDS